MIREVAAVSVLLVLVKAGDQNRHNQPCCRSQPKDQIAQQDQHELQFQKYPEPLTKQKSMHHQQWPSHRQQYQTMSHDQTESNNTHQKNYHHIPQHQHRRNLHSEQIEGQRQEDPTFQQHHIHHYELLQEQPASQHQDLHGNHPVIHGQHHIPLYQVPIQYLLLQNLQPKSLEQHLHYQQPDQQQPFQPVQGHQHQSTEHDQQQHVYFPMPKILPQSLHSVSTEKGIPYTTGRSHKIPLFSADMIYHQHRVPQDFVLHSYMAYNNQLFPIQVPLNKPYALPVPNQYSGRSIAYNVKKIPVFKPYPVYHQRKVPYTVLEYLLQPYLVLKKEPYPVHIPVDKPYAVHVPKPYPVVVEKKVPYTVEKQVPYEVREYIDKPYPIQVPVFKRVPYTVERKVPYKVEVPVETPVPVVVPKPYPVFVVKKVPYTLEKLVPYPIKIHQPVPVLDDQVKSNSLQQGYQEQSYKSTTTTDTPRNESSK